MKILVTGATGFIGSSLCLKLVEAGNTVHAFGRSVSGCAALHHSNIILNKGDILDRAALNKAAQGCDQAYHLAAFVKVRAKKPDDYYNINVVGTINVMDACIKAGVRKVVFTSTCGTFPSSGEGNINNEASQRKPIFFNEYAATKYKAENIALEYEKKGLDVVIVSPTRVFGPGPLSESNSLSRLIKLYMDGKLRILPGNGKAIGNYAFIEDVAEGHIKAMELGKTGENYLLGGENIPVDELIAILKKEMNEEKWMIKVNPLIILILIYLQEFIFKILNIPPFITASWYKRMGKSSLFSSKKAIEELHYRITPFPSGIKQTLQYLGYQK